MVQFIDVLVLLLSGCKERTSECQNTVSNTAGNKGTRTVLKNKINIRGGGKTVHVVQRRNQLQGLWAGGVTSPSPLHISQLIPKVFNNDLIQNK
jgi:hypothetical protein